MRLERLAADDPVAAAAALRALAPEPASVAGVVAEIVADVRARGDVALRELTRRFDGPAAADWPIRVDAVELDGALAALGTELRAALELAAANVRSVALAGLGGETVVELPQGQRVVLREIPVRRAAVYVPAGRAPYPSTVVMGVVTAQAAGVEQVAVCAPPAANGEAHQVILAACALLGVGEVYRMGGAQAVAALALGTDSVSRVDVIVGPGNLYVQEAKRAVAGVVGVDGFAGPSDVLVLLSAGADPRLAALDLLAQAEHGPESLVAAVSAEPGLLDAVADEVAALAQARPGAEPAACALVDAPDLQTALELAEAFAPEHLELVGQEAESLAPRVRSAGCVFVGAAGATAFGDYVAGSNHILPTAGAARFGSGLSPRAFRRRVSEVHIGPPAPELARAGATIARAEGFEVHAESMEARIGENGAR